MPRTGPSRQQPRDQRPRRPVASGRTGGSLQKSALWTELTGQRALLLVGSTVSLTVEDGPEICPDPADQAAIYLEQDLAMQVKVRRIAKLRRIERALQLMRTSGYGQCRRCHEDIPYERLKVQPDAFFCVPCLTYVEKEAATH